VDSSQRHSSVVSILAEKEGEMDEDDENVGDDGDEILDVRLLDFELREEEVDDKVDDVDGLESKEEENMDDDLLETKEEEDVDDGVLETKEEEDVDDGMLMLETKEEEDVGDDVLETKELIDEASEDELLRGEMTELVDENTLVELEDSSHRHSSVVSMLADRDNVELDGIIL